MTFYRPESNCCWWQWPIQAVYLVENKCQYNRKENNWPQNRRTYFIKGTLGSISSWRCQLVQLQVAKKRNSFLAQKINLTYSCLHMFVHIINQHKFGTLYCNTNFSATVASIDKWFVASWMHHLRAAPYSSKTVY